MSKNAERKIADLLNQKKVTAIEVATVCWLMDPKYVRELGYEYARIGGHYVPDENLENDDDTVWAFSGGFLSFLQEM